MEEQKHVQGLVHFTPLCKMCALEQQIKAYEVEIASQQKILDWYAKELAFVKSQRAALFDKLKDAGL